MRMRRSQHVAVSRQAMACTFSLAFPAGYPHAVEAGCAALDEIERLEEKLSVFRPDSDISRINREARDRAVRADAEVFDVLAIGQRISRETDGAFDCASGELVTAWGWGTAFHRRGAEDAEENVIGLETPGQYGVVERRIAERFKASSRVPAAEVREAALSQTGMRWVELNAGERTVRFLRPVKLNLGAIGKGYAIDRALSLIAKEFGPSPVLMHGGQSSIRAVGAPPREHDGWLVAIGDPFRPGRAVALIRLKDRALGTSGADHQFFEHDGRRYGHVLDPRTGIPAAQVASATALAPTAAEADALSTAFFVAGVERTREYVRTHPGIAAVIVTRPRINQRPEVIALGLDEGQIEFTLPPNPDPAGRFRQPMQPTRPAGFFQARGSAVSGEGHQAGRGAFHAEKSARPAEEVRHA